MPRGLTGKLLGLGGHQQTRARFGFCLSQALFTSLISSFIIFEQPLIFLRVTGVKTGFGKRGAGGGVSKDRRQKCSMQSPVNRASRICKMRMDGLASRNFKKIFKRAYRKGAVEKTRNVTKDVSQNMLPFRDNVKFKAEEQVPAKEDWRRGGQPRDSWSLVKSRRRARQASLGEGGASCCC